MDAPRVTASDGGLAEALGQGIDPGSEILAGQVPHLADAPGLPLSAWSWALFQGVRDPYVVIIAIYIFAPYFSSVVVGDPVRGQTLVANISTTEGVIVCLTAPLLGSVVNRLGPRKPWLALTALIMCLLTACLWFVHPGPGGLPIWTAAVLLGAIPTFLISSDVLHNALIRFAAPAHKGAAASGLAYALVNAVSVSVLVFILWAFVLPGRFHWPVLPRAPLFGLSSALHEPERISGPLVAGLMALGAVPFFFLCPDAPRSTTPLRLAVREGLRELKETLALLKTSRDIALYLGARMLYTDGKTALLAFGGLYAQGVMRWGVLQMLAYGLILSCFAVIGGGVGALLDQKIGPRRAVMVEVAGSLACVVASTGMRPDVILYVMPWSAAHPAAWSGGLYTSLPELIYLGIGCGTAVFVTAAYASSRTLLARLAPPERLGSFFGLYALSGSATMWLGSLLVGLFTALMHSQQAGFLAIAALLALGLALMGLVRGGDAEPSPKAKVYKN